MRRRLTTLALTGAAVLALPAAASAQAPTTYTANLSQANESGASGTVTIQLDGTTADIRIDGRGFFDGFPHAIHLHGEPGWRQRLRPAQPGRRRLRRGGRGRRRHHQRRRGRARLRRRRRLADHRGRHQPRQRAGRRPLPDLQHARLPPHHRAARRTSPTTSAPCTWWSTPPTSNGSGEIGDFGTPSSLDPDLDIEATVPAACGQLVASAAGGVDTGAGGTATDTGGAAALFAGALGLGALGTVAMRRRLTDAV
jgi:hypothetical protein